MDFTRNFDCIDSGTENCPCYLAATGDCLVCSRLQGKQYCDCLWNGVCIYNEFVQNNCKVNNPRKDFLALIVSKEQYLDDLYAITLDVGRGFALRAAIPGSYVFLQMPDMEAYYHTPISIMRSDTNNGFITVLVKSISAKTKALCSAQEKLLVRGVYRSGISGLSTIRGRFSRILNNSKVLIVTKGVGFAPAVNFIDWAGKMATIDVLIDVDKLCASVVDDYLQKDSIASLEFLKLSDIIDCSSPIPNIRSRILDGKYSAVVVLTSDYYIEEIRKIISLLDNPPAFVCSNNANICCGEGICGACSCTDASGQTCKRCKCL